MLIAFPNTDHSFTCSLHMPHQGPVSYASVRSGRDLTELFEKSFPDAIGLLPRLGEEFMFRPHNSMVTIRCSPWIVEDSVALIGDAAHAIYPSYGQGANAGAEDCRVLLECLEAQHHDWSSALAQYEALRKPNADAIADLSEQHFIELRDLVGDSTFLLRKEVERRINKLYPDKFRDLYSMVTFTTMPYLDAVEMDRQMQVLVDRIISTEDFAHEWNSGRRDPMIREIMDPLSDVMPAGDLAGPTLR
jgi:kynurenine 3-monooxygenase